MYLSLLFAACFVIGEVSGKCGVTPVSQTRVIGGKDAKEGAWPWQVALKKKNGFFFCGGSLISEEWVVTAAHCVHRSSPNSFDVIVGEHNQNVNEGTEEKIPVQRVISHPNYQKPVGLNNDIALLKLAQRVRLSSRVNSVCLPSDSTNVATGSTCYITGWGKIKHPGGTHHILQQAMMPPVDNAICKRKAGDGFTDQMLCAGKQDTILSGCHGDSGGPYVCLNDDQRTYTLHGAVSWGSGTCDAKKMFTYFARVTQFLSWIKQHTGIGGGKPPPQPPTKPPLPPTSGHGQCYNFDKRVGKKVMPFCKRNGGCAICITTEGKCAFGDSGNKAELNERKKKTIKMWLRSELKKDPPCSGSCNICMGPFVSGK